MTRGDIKKLQIIKINNVVAHVFPRKSTRHSNKTFKSLDSQTNINIFFKPNMIFHPPYHLISFIILRIKYFTTFT